MRTSYGRRLYAELPFLWEFEHREAVEVRPERPVCFLATRTRPGREVRAQSFTFEATYDDRPKDSPTIATDKSGRFELKGQLRAKPMTLCIRGEHGGWEGEGLDASAGSLDLGQVVLDPARAEKR